MGGEAGGRVSPIGGSGELTSVQRQLRPFPRVERDKARTDAHACAHVHSYN